MASKKKVRSGEEFVFCNGAIAATLAQCRKEIRQLTEEQFAYHVNAEKNDIHVWIRDCLDPAMAERVRGLRERAPLLKALAE